MPARATFLRDIGAWDHLDARRIAPVRRMEVFGDAGAKLSFSGARGQRARVDRRGGPARERAGGAGRDLAVGHVLRREARAVAFEASAERAAIVLEGGERLEGDLLVGADGPDSRVRALLGLDAARAALWRDRDRRRISRPRSEHGEVARQWFRADGVLAWLPLPGQRISIVWSAPEAVAAELAALDGPAFERRVREAGAGVLGDLGLISKVGAVSAAPDPGRAHGRRPAWRSSAMRPTPFTRSRDRA